MNNEELLILNYKLPNLGAGPGATYL